MKNIIVVFAVLLSPILCYSNQVEDEARGWLWNSVQEPYFAHNIESVENDGSTLKLEDHSTWKISTLWNSNIVKSWKEGDIIRLSFDPFYDYYHWKLENYTMDHTVHGRLEIYPDQSHPKCLTIESIDFSQLILVLSDGTTFKGKKKSHFLDWEPGHVVILIDNDYYNDSFPYAVYNLDREKMVFAFDHITE